VLQTSVPLSTTSGVVHFVVVGLWTGCRLVCEQRFGVEDTLCAMAEQRATVWLCVPSMMILVCDGLQGVTAPATMRAVWHMGSVPPIDSIRNACAAFPTAAILNLYSLTETGAGVVGSAAADALARPGCTGRPAPSTRVRVVAEDGSPSPLGELGEIHFDSPYMFDGYYRNAEATAAKRTADGWFQSGDGGYLDADGVLWVTGRLNDVIVRGGFKFNPVLVENALASFPGVVDAAVAPVPHRVLGHDLLGFAVTDGRPLDPAALRAPCLQSLPDNEVPRRIEQVSSIPRNEFGKIDRRAMRALAEAIVASGR
jgi:acyl-CoA synthetase (AMP-forming)/AMP-acid ligase II